MSKFKKLVSIFVLVFTVTLTSLNIMAKEDIIPLVDETLKSNIYERDLENEDDVDLSFDSVSLKSDTVETVSGAHESTSLSRFDIYTNPVKTSYLAGEEVLFYVGISLTEDSGTLSNTILEVKVLKEHLVSGSFIASDINSQLSNELIETADAYIVRYYLQPLSSGTNIDVPIKFTSKNGMTPHNLDLPVIANFMNKDESNMISSIKEDFVIQTLNPKLTKYVKNKLVWNSNDHQVIEAGKLDPLKPGYLSSRLEDLDFVEFSYNLTQTNNSNTAHGKRIYEKYVIKDILPDNAVFIASENPGWTFDEVSRVATYTLENPKHTALGNIDFFNDVKLKLKFSNQAVDTPIKNTMVVEAYPLNKPDYEAVSIVQDDVFFSVTPTKEDHGPENYFARKSVSPYFMYDIDKDRNTVFKWKLEIKNTAKLETHPHHPLSNIEVLDHSLDSNMKYTGIQFNPNQALVGSVDVLVNYNDGTQIELVKGLKIDKAHYFDFERQEDIKSILVKSTENSYLESNKTFSFTLSTMLKDPSIPVLETGQYSKRLFNTGDFKAQYPNTTLIKQESKESILFNALIPKLSLSKYVSNPKQTYFLNDVLTYNLAINAHGFGRSLSFADLNKVVDILPVGFEYVENSAKLNVSIYPSVITDFKKGEYSYEPSVVHNYMQTGRTALIWDVKPFTIGGDNIQNSFNSVYKLSYNTKITELTKQGKNENNAYLSWKNNEEVTPYNNKVEDIYDINENQNTQDFITSSKAVINYVPPKELIISKSVKGSLDKQFVLPPSHGYSELKDTTDYKFTLFNNSIMDLKTLQILDLLPHQLDKTVSLDITLQTPARIERKSNFKLGLLEPLKVPTGYKVYYTTDNTVDIEDVKVFYQHAKWEESVDDYSLVTAFKVELLEGYRLKSGEEISFIAKFKTPFDTQLNQDDMAVNSFAVSTSPSMNFFESNLSAVKIVKYSVDGTIFNDLNKDNLLDSNDLRFKNHKVVLEDQDGNPALDLDGNPLETWTNEEGYYKFDVYRQGSYRVKILKPDQFSSVETSSPIETKGSHLLLKQDHTDYFTLTPTRRHETRNAGYKQTKIDYTVTKNWINGPLVKEDITVQLYQNNKPFKDPVIIKAGESSYTWKNIDKLDENDLEYVYTVDEISTHDNYIKDVQGSIITNTYQSLKTEYTMNKVWVNGPDVHPNIEIQLYRNGEAYLSPVTLSNQETSYTWTDLDLTDESGVAYVYTVDEVSTHDNYIKDVQGSVITNTYQSLKTEYTMNKVWVKGPDVHPSIEIQLYRNGEAYLSPVTLSNQETSYTWTDLDLTDESGVAYVYTVDEVSTHENYIKDVQGSIITNTYVDENPPEDSNQFTKSPDTGISLRANFFTFIFILGLFSFVRLKKKTRV